MPCAVGGLNPAVASAGGNACDSEGWPGIAMAGAKFVLKVITPDSPFPRTYTFPSVIQKGKSVYELGLTGSDWPGRHAHPVAWKLQLLAPDGTELVQQISFLWNPMDA